MATEKRLIVLQDAIDIIVNTPSEIAKGVTDGRKRNWSANDVLGVLADRQFEIFVLLDMVKRVDAYTKEQLTHILNSLDKAEAENKELRTENAWLKSCINCKIRKECPRHCGKVVHDCDHWEYGDNTPTVDAVEVVHGRWVQKAHDGAFGVFHLWHCSVCDTIRARQDPYCGECGAKMDGGSDNG